ncbi:GAP family protein [Mycobacterium camsae]|uniref:GAP family protein n=1 Tax=Mycobacterium gordonae TaxID=1778 RepID=UPI001980A40E|nr:GAP family protein [Mycobacterium gordonae]
MWQMVLYMGFGMALDPARLGLALVMLSRKRPMANLFAFWLGGIVAAGAVALAVLLFIREFAVVVIQSAGAMAQDFREATVVLSGGRLQVTVGVIILLLAVRSVARSRAQAGIPVPVGGGGGLPTMVLDQRPPGLMARTSNRMQEMLNCDVVWPAFLVGIATSVPPLESLIALTFIMASGSGIGTQFGAFFVFVLLVLAVIEIPLIAHLTVPQKTEQLMLRVQNWVRTYRRQMTLTILFGVGCIFLAQGVAAL